ncbi:MAG: DUF664 domain-containing protein [Ardenticatenaceae bacterium]|nr:DUF664 domain-containing protein [Anaerolineales bacterium]MCB8921787.1 DUF664 domain-containing protein [Ardenticatenaceae bacterium]MCB8990694.1 DUF664 domain-containing protein [Ardenticatenaceae bacterium]
MDMPPLFADYLERLQALHHSIATTIEGLPPEALRWQPGQDMNSIGVLVTHTAGAERFWMGDMVQQDPSGRVRADEFTADQFTAAGLQQLLQDTLAHSTQVLVNLTHDDLEREVFSGQHGRSFRVAWSLMHALEHTAQHMGHIDITRQLWEQQTATK